MHPWLCDGRVSERLVCLRHSRPSASYPETYQRPQGVCVGWVGESRCGMGLVTRVVWVPNRCSSSHSVTGVGEGLAGEAGGVGMWVSDGCNPACSHTSRTSGVGGGDCSLFSRGFVLCMRNVCSLVYLNRLLCVCVFVCSLVLHADSY